MLNGFNSSAQFSNFESGFKLGFKNGYCYSTDENSIGCIPPLTPLSPLPRYPESSGNFQDGYNRGFLVGNYSRRNIDDKTTNSTITKFNPYVSQLSSFEFSPEEMAALNAAKAAKFQATAEAFVNLLSVIFTSTPEGKMKRELGKVRRKQVKYQKQIDRFEKKEAKRLVVGSDSYINCSKSRKVWLGSMLLSGAAGAFSYTQANNYALKYNNATTDASSIKKTGNIFYTAAPICFAAAGFSLIEYAIKTRKIKKAKPQSVYLYPQISPNNLGLNLTVKF